MIDLQNPANSNGKITSVEVWFDVNGSDVKVGTFHGSGTEFTSRDFETIGAVTSGSKQTFNELDIDVQTGDFIGIYFNAGSPELDASGGVMCMSKSGDQFGAGEQTYDRAGGPSATFAISVYGIGAGGQIAKINGIDIDKIKTINGIDISKIKNINGIEV